MKKEKEIEIIIPKGYRLSNKSTEERIVLEIIVEKSVEDEAKEFLINIFDKMKVRVEPDTPCHVYYDVDGMGFVFEKDFENAYLLVSYSHIWNVLRTKFSMKDSEIQLFIKKVVDELLNWKGLTPQYTYRQTTHHS